MLFSLLVAASVAEPYYQSTVIDNCNGVDELPNGDDPHDCHWSTLFDPTLCNASAPCDNLVVFFSGGGMRCEDREQDMFTHLELYAESGYVAIAACVLPSAEQNGGDKVADNYPFASEHLRVDELMRVTTRWARLGPWTGKNLLISGASHGGAALTHALNNDSLHEENSNYWWGDDPTTPMPRDGVSMVCVYDPPLDARSREATYWADPDNRPGTTSDCNATRDGNVCERYGVRTLEGGPLDGRTVCGAATYDERCADPTLPPEPASCTPLLDLDDLATDPAPSRYAHSTWRFVSCTGNPPPAAGACTRGVPNDGPDEPPMRAVCDAIAGVGKSCEVRTYNQVSHLDCGGREGPGVYCKNVFDALVVP